VYTIVDPTSYKLYINPPERQLAHLRVGQVAKVTVDAVQGQEFDARVARINPSVDPATGTVKVTLEFEPETLKKLKDGAFARVKLVMETRDDTLLVPKDAVVEDNARKYVFVVEPREAPAAARDAASMESAGAEPALAPGTAEGAVPQLVAQRLEIETGLEDSDNVEVLSGLDGQASIVTLGQDTLKSGAAVRVTNAREEMAAQAGLPADEALARAAAKREAGTNQTQAAGANR